MQIYLFRHAEKDSASSTNPPLSTGGQRQAEGLAAQVVNKIFIKPELLLASPKLRAQQTFLPLSQNMKIPLKSIVELDERIRPETAAQFLNRVKNQVAWLGQQSSSLFVVTHLDWVEEALSIIPANIDISEGKYRNWKPAQYMQFEIKDGLWHLLQFGSIAK